MMTGRYLYLLLLTASTLLAVAGGDSGPVDNRPQPLTLEECIGKALKTHPDVKISVLHSKLGRQEVALEESARLPQVSLHAAYDLQRTYVLAQNGTFGTRDDDSFEVGATLSQKLWDFSKTSRRVDASRIAKEAAEISREEAEAMMRYRVQTLYALAVLQEATVAVRRKDREAKRALYDQARALVAQGLKTKADESRFLAAFQQAEDDLSTAESGFKKAKIALGFLIGEPIPEAVRLDEGLFGPGTKTPAADESLFLKSSPRLRIAAKEASQAALLYKAADARKYGSIDAIAAYTRFDTLSTYETTQAGVRYSLPLFSGGKLGAEAQRAKIAHAVAVSRRDSSRRELLREFRELIIDLGRYEQTIETRMAQLQSAQETKNVVEGRYAEGLSTYMEVLDAATLWLEAKLGLLKAYYARANTLYRLTYLKGGGHDT